VKLTKRSEKNYWLQEGGRSSQKDKEGSMIFGKNDVRKRNRRNISPKEEKQPETT